MPSSLGTPSTTSGEGGGEGVNAQRYRYRGERTRIVMAMWMQRNRLLFQNDLHCFRVTDATFPHVLFHTNYSLLTSSSI